MSTTAETVYLFAGDSLVEGIYGVSYVERVALALADRYPERAIRVVNAGRGGDTVAALDQRIEGLLHEHRPAQVVLAVGANDVWMPWLTGHSLDWKIWFLVRRLRWGQAPTTDLDQFAAVYRSLIDRCRRAGAQVLVCTASPIGEQLSSPINHQVARLNGVIKHVATGQQVPVADVWQAFVEELSRLPRGSSYVSGEWLFSMMDRRRYQAVGPDAMAVRRRLNMTFDGVHLTTQGAELWARTVLAALHRATAAPDAALPRAALPSDLACFEQGLLAACCSPGWEQRTASLAASLAAACELLSAWTNARPAVNLALLAEAHWRHSACPGAYPTPRLLWDGETATLFVPDAYADGFLRHWHLPQAVADAGTWPVALANLGELAQATALADLLALQELARAFLFELRVAPADPGLARLLAAYLVQAVLHHRDPLLAVLWNGWGRLLARAGAEEGRVRLQALKLFHEQGTGLVSSLSGHTPAIEEKVHASLAAGPQG